MGGGLAPDRKQMWNFWQISSLQFASKNTFYLIVRGLKNAFCKFKLKIQRQNVDQS